MSEEIKKFSLKEFLLQEHKMLRVKDIEKDITWLYKKQGDKKPKIVIFKSRRKFKKFLDEETRAYSDPERFGLHHEMSYFSNCKNYNGELDKDVERYINFLNKGVWEFIPTHLRSSGNNVAVILPLPKKLRVDEQNRYHSLKHPAVQWHDNKGKYFIQGVRFSKILFKQVCNRELASLKVLEIPNMEQRQVTLRMYGIDKLFKDLNPQLLDTFEREVRGQPNKMELYRINVSDRQTSLDNFNVNENDRNNVEGEINELNDYIHVIRYKDPSTEREYTSFVPDDIYLACSAMAWKNSLRTIAYVKHLVVEA